MKFEYEKPALEEIELVLEGSFLEATSTDVPVKPGQGGDEENPDYWD